MPARPRAKPSAPASASLGGSGLELKHLLMLAGVFLLGAHAAFAREEFLPLGRLLLAIPGLFLLWELHRYSTSTQDRELPSNVVGLVYYYVAFSFPCFFKTQFFDLNGPVSFTDNAYTMAPAAVAMGVCFLYLGMRAGEQLGHRLRPGVQSMSPPAEVSPAFPRATFMYLGICVVLTMVFVSAPSLVPGDIGVLVTNTIAFDFAIALPLVMPDYFKGKWTKYTSLLVVLVGGAGGLIRGVIDPVARLGVASVVGRWANSRRLAVGVIVGVLSVYIVVQPIKQDFRQQVWRHRGTESIGYVERLDAWVNAFSGFWSREDTQEETQDAAVGRLAELDAVLHAMDMLPGQVEPLEGKGWIAALTSPIPRVIWRDKPTTSSTVDQRYAVVFKRQSEVGARSTAILLPLVVEGYWNFEWLGIGISCFVMGLWVGVIQSLFSGPHWALRAMGVAHLSRLVAQGPISGLFSGIFQHLTGLFLATWALYFIEKFLARGAKSPRNFGGSGATARQRRLLRALPPRISTR